MTASLPNLPPTPSDPFGLLLDVDGTLIDFAPRPDAVVVPPSLTQALRTLSERLDSAVALISGRSIADLDRLFHPLRLRASGVHGAEWRLKPEADIVSAAEAALPETTIAGLQAIAARHEGTFVENKRFSAAIHYRAAPEAGPNLAQSLEVLVASAPDLRVLPGHMVFEIKHAGFDKGVAVERFLAGPPFSGRTPVFIGDDVTDEPGLAVTAAHGGIACAVGRERSGATHIIASPADVREWLTQLAARLSSVPAETRSTATQKLIVSDGHSAMQAPD